MASAGDIDRSCRAAGTGGARSRIDQLLVGLSRAADHSKLWLVLAAVAASFGGKPGADATRASVRARVGRLTSLVSAADALRERGSFTCSLRHDGVVDELTLLSCR